MEAKRHRRYEIGAALLAISCPAAAMAQESGPDEEQRNVRQGEIIVTATRREASLQDVPISVTALTSEALKSAGIQTTSDLVQVTPGLVYARSISAIQFAMRGVSSRAVSQGDESSIAIYVDGVYQPTAQTTSFELDDIERVEVLRGPQGTLFGRNATVGLINIITKSPEFEWGGTANLRYSPTFDERQVTASVTGPLSDKIAFRIAGIYSQDDGYVRNIFLDEQVGKSKNIGVRGKLLFEPSDDVRLTLGGSYSDSDSDVGGSGTALFNPVLGIPQNVSVGVPGAITTTQPWRTAQTFVGFNKLKMGNVWFKGEVGLGAVDLEVNASYQHSKATGLTDSDYSSANLFNVATNGKSDAFTGEIRLSGSSDRFEWTAGLFGFQNKTASTPLRVEQGATVIEFFSGNDTKSLAGYGEGTFAITPRLSLLAGLRYTWEKREFDGIRYITIPTRPVIEQSVDVSTSFSKWTPRVSLQYEFSPSVQGYATYSRGFKSGIFNTNGPNPDPTEPETLDSYEVGLKTSFDGWLRANLSIFRFDYSDIQVTARTDDGLIKTVNAAKARVEGGEFELSAQATDEFRFTLALAYANSRFIEFPSANIAIPLPNGTNNTNGIIDAAGNNMIRAPELTVNFGVNYSKPINDNMTVGFSGNFYRSTKYYFDFNNRLTQPGYTKINARAWVMPMPSLRVGVFGDNLTNAKVLVTGVSSSSGDWGIYDKPRIWGLFANYDF